MLATIVLALMTGAAVFAVLWPLGRSKVASPDVIERATDAAFYRSQVAEIERDAARGLLEPNEAEVARTEAARRLLASTRRGEAPASDASAAWRRRAAAVIAIAGIPLIALPLYLEVGQPGLPGQPLASRGDRPATAAGGLDMADAVARIEAHLSRNPEDGKGWEIIAPVYVSAGRYEDAVRAYAAALRILGEAPARLEGYGEAIVAAADGVVTQEARQVFDKALAADPRLVKARYYSALAADQDGDRSRARGLYEALLGEAPAGSPLASRLTERVVALGGTPPAGAAIAALPEGDRMAAIRGMVEGLDARLAQGGGGVDDWLRLVRSYAVLGEPAKAREALARGRGALAADAQGRERLEALARELRIGGGS